MGLSATRRYGAIPRALAVAVVAVPKMRPRLELVDRTRPCCSCAVTPAGSTLKGSGTDLGTALVTTVEQTLLDLAHRPDLGGVPAEAAVAALWPLADQALLDELAAGQRLRAAIDRAQVWAELYPEQLRAEIDAANDDVFRDVNNGVYRAGFAGSQDAYEQAYHRLFDRLDRLSDRLESQRSLVGDTITEAGVRLFPTLVRFDPGYHGHFKCNRAKLTEMPVLWAYAPDLRGWLTPHGREVLDGRPFGDGTPPPPPPPPAEVVPAEHAPLAGGGAAA